MKQRRSYRATGVASGLALAVLVLMGLGYSFREDARVPAADLRYMPYVLSLVEAGQLEEAHAELSMAAKLDPRNLTALGLLARVSKELGDPSGELQALRLMVAERPEDARFRLWLSQALLERARESDGPRSRRRAELAISSAEVAIRFDPHSAAAYQTLGEAWLLLGEREMAERHLREALRLDPTLDSARQGLRRAREAANRS